MTCPRCAHILDQPDLLHCIRVCDFCGREMRVHEKGKHGIGMEIMKGDRIALPPGFLKFSFDPTKSSGHFFKSGLQWFAKLLFIAGLPKRKNDIEEVLRAEVDHCTKRLQSSPLLEGHSFDDQESATASIAKLHEHKETAEWWTYCVGLFTEITQSAISDGDCKTAAWSAACAERCRAMLIFKDELESVVWMGHSAKRVVGALATWQANRTNSDEAFWQHTLSQHSYLLSQVFAAPLVVIGENAYIGGMALDRKGGRFVDYLGAMESSSQAVLIEIKTPTSGLLGRRYRGGIFRPSSELSGAVVQLRNYRSQLTRNVEGITKDSPNNLDAADPRCALIVGDAESQLDEPARRRSFELFRAGLRDVEVVTYDELFRKAEVLAGLFGLARQDSGASEEEKPN